ncbi:MAG: rhomboid family intramembrane serine protease [Spirochaetaceae bacterium]|jgi:membrane associated rhomboid family serine protease|nr:rhomboid family intramembrane serine protease [Spirochaetaceae bacterium]
MNIINKPFVYKQYGVYCTFIVINIIVFAAQQFLGDALSIHLSIVPALILRGELWTFVTYMFAHGSVSHILFNMIALFVFGKPLEEYMGSIEFLVYYLLTGIFAGIFSFGAYMLTGNLGCQLLGASGALFAVELAYAVFFPNAVIYFWGILPLRAPLMVMFFTSLELFFSVTGLDAGVAHFTHLAGFLFGWLYFLVRFRINPWKRLFSK